MIYGITKSINCLIMIGNIANGNFVEKNDNSCQFKKKKIPVFGNFLTLKWQFSRGSGQLQGCQIWPKIGPDWHQIGQIWDCLRSFSVHIGSEDLKLLIKIAAVTHWSYTYLEAATAHCTCQFACFTWSTRFLFIPGNCLANDAFLIPGLLHFEFE